MSEIKEKLEAEMKAVKSMCETMENAIKTQMDKGLDHVDTHEMYEAVDIFKDLTEVKKNIAKTCYYTQLMEAMEGAEYGEDYDENGEIRYYRGQTRSKTSGRYMKRGDGRREYHGKMPVDYQREWDDSEMRPYNPYRDMDRSVGRMYYTDNSTSGSASYGAGTSDSSMNTGNRGAHGQMGRDSREGRSGLTRRSYMETKTLHDGNGENDKKERTEARKEYINTLREDMLEMINGLPMDEKQAWKNDLNVMMQKL